MSTRIQTRMALNRYPLRSRQNSKISESGVISSGTDGRSYRDAVISRPSSAASQHENSISGDAVTGDAVYGDAVDRIDSEKSEKIVSFGGESEPDVGSLESEDERPWTIVKSRRTRSMESLRDLRLKSKLAPVKNARALTAEQDTVVAAANNNLTAKEKDLISKRYAKLKPTVGGLEEKAESGPSNEKGKTTDPRNWGAAGIPRDELSVEAQKLALESWAVEQAAKMTEQLVKQRTNIPEPITPDVSSSKPSKAQAFVETVSDEGEPLRRAAKAKASPHKKVDAQAPRKGGPSKRPSPMSETVAKQVAEVVGSSRRAKARKAATKAVNITPMSQVAPGSYIGHALGVGVLQNSPEASRKRHKKRDSDSDSSSSSASTNPGPAGSGGSGSNPSSSSSDTSSSDGSSVSASTERRRKRRKRSRSKSKSHGRRANQTRKSRSTLKPIAPREYDGAADGRAFHRFVTEGTDYVVTGKVSRKRRVFVLSYYLKGRAYDFYTQKVANTSYDWDLQRFFSEMFNYCFPIDFRMTQRDKLKRCFQNEKSVSEFVYELEELYNMIGAVDERERIIKLWKSLQPIIQKGLWREGLNPEVSTWDEVRDAAQVIEIAERVVASTSSRRGGQVSSGGGSFNGRGNSGGGGSRNPRGNGGSRGSGFTNSQPPRNDERPKNQKGSDKKGSSYEAQRDGGHGGKNTVSSSRRDGGRPGKKVDQPQLSKEERNEHLAAGKCFKCHETGHLARNCPTGNSVKSSRGPPGLASHHIDINFDESERLRDLADLTEIVEELRVGSVSMYDEGAPTGLPQRRQLGDLAAQRAMSVLEAMRPYPGDEDATLDEEERRFLVYRIEGGYHVVMDADIIVEDSAVVETSLLFTDEFNLPEWYAQWRAADLGASLAGGNRWEAGPRMGDVLARGLANAIREGHATYDLGSDDMTAGDRWCVEVMEVDGFRDYDTYVIRDLAGSTHIPVQRARLLEDTFDVITWFREERVRRVRIREAHLGQPCYEGCPYCVSEGIVPVIVWPSPVGDVFGRAAAQLLNATQPFPGDTVPLVAERFRVNRMSATHYTIVDIAVPQVYHLAVSQVRDPMFGLASWYITRRMTNTGLDREQAENVDDMRIGIFVGYWITSELERGSPYPGDWRLPAMRGDRFEVRGGPDYEYWSVWDHLRLVEVHVPLELILNNSFDLRAWYAAQMRSLAPSVESSSDDGSGPSSGRDDDSSEPGSYGSSAEALDSVIKSVGELSFDDARSIPNLESVSSSNSLSEDSSSMSSGSHRSFERGDSSENGHLFGLIESHKRSFTRAAKLADVEEWRAQLPDFVAMDEIQCLEVNGIQVPRGTYDGLQRNAAIPKDFTRVVPKPVVIVVMINGHPARALLDSGSLGDFMSSTLADQLKVSRIELAKPLSLQLAVQGSRSKINLGTRVNIRYQRIDEERYFDIANLSGYDLILGTPWMFQHSATVGLNPARVVVGSDKPHPIKGEGVSRIASRAIEALEDNLERVRQELVAYAEPLCREAGKTDLPPFRAINHQIPLLDEKKVYPWRPSKCPEVFRPQWAEKRDSYLKSGRWRVTSSGNTVPMLLIPKPGKTKGDKPELRTVVDLRARNANTAKLTSPLPDIEGILRRAAKARFKSLIDGKDAYEQIRIIPEHVNRSTVTTPDGNMVSLVIQIGDCNAPATYQALMNHLFSAYIGRFMDIYLDDIVVYSHTLKDHVSHVKLVIDILRREKLYLSKNKLFFLQEELKLLGHVIGRDGIRMDPAKVNSVVAWKTPTNRDLLRGFLGSVGYLADDLAAVRVPMGVLHSLTGDTVPFRWEYTHQRAFEDIKSIVSRGRDHCRVPLTYGKGAKPVFLITDGSATGIAGVVSQGVSWKTAKVAAFFSAKLSSAQRNYPVHEIEMLAGVEAMLRHADILQGTHFEWVTDHKGLIHLVGQKNLSGRQARWLEKLSMFDFEVTYVPGVENVLADALSRLYSNDAPGTVRARSEYTYYDVVNDDVTIEHDITIPLLAGVEAVAVGGKRRTRKAIPSADTGRPETAREFASRMKAHITVRAPKQPETAEDFAERMKSKRFRLHGPRPKEAEAGDVEPVALRDNLPEPGSLVDVVSSARAGIDLLKILRGSYVNDLAFKPVVDNPKHHRNFEFVDDLLYIKLKDRRLLCIPKLVHQGRNVREIVIAEGHSILAHLGAAKTLAYLRDHVWWKDMAGEVATYCATCRTCRRSKPSNQKPYGLLNPLNVPSQPWEAIGVDFVGPLPESKNRDGTFDSLTVVIDLLTAMVHLVPSRINYKAREVAELMFEEIYKLHGLPKAIVSDRDVLFTSIFWKRLHELVGTQLRMSSAYHPETDGSTERANRTVTQMIRQCIGPKQKDWVSKVPAIEFAINSARSSSTGYAPFFLNTGRMPRSMIWDSAKQDEFPGIRNFALARKLAIMAAHDSVLAARVMQIRDANRKRRLVPFVEGDLVYVSSKNITFQKGLARKLIPKYIGPYKILRDFRNQSFKLDLPSHLLQRGIHDVFHASLLRAHVANDDRLFPGRLDTQLGNGDGTEGEWSIDRIVGHAGSKEDAVFEILWKSGDRTWLPFYQVEHLNAIGPYLELIGVDKVADLPKGKGVPPRNDPQVFIGNVKILRDLREEDKTTVGLARKPLPGPGSSFACTPCSSTTHPNPRLPTVSSNRYSLNPTSPFAQHYFDTFHDEFWRARLGPHPGYPGHPDCRWCDDAYNHYRALSSAMSSHPWLTRTNCSTFILESPDASFPTLGIHAGQMRSYLAHDDRLHRNLRVRASPVGYDEFASRFNSAPGVVEKFATVDPNGHVVVNGAILNYARFAVADETQIVNVDKLRKMGRFLDWEEASMFDEFVRREAMRSMNNARDARKRRADMGEYAVDPQNRRTQKKPRVQPQAKVASRVAAVEDLSDLEDIEANSEDVTMHVGDTPKASASSANAAEPSATNAATSSSVVPPSTPATGTAGTTLPPTAELTAAQLPSFTKEKPRTRKEKEKKD